MPTLVTEPPRRLRLLQIAGVFLRLGVTAFGGPAAHVAMMENEFVRRRGWLTHERFLDLLGTSNLIPGPSSSELALFIGYEHGGVSGLFVAAACFITPAALMSGACAWAYVEFGSLPGAAGVLYGVKPVIIAVVLQALAGLAPKAIRHSKWLALLAAVSGVLAFAGASALEVLLGAGAVCMLARTASRSRPNLAVFCALPALASAHALRPSIGRLFFEFFKIGSSVFGSGYVLLAVLRADFVERLGWMTDAQLMDAVAVGQITPGPVFSTATFIGYLLAGVRGAVAATVAIFLPGLLLVIAIRPLVHQIRNSPAWSAFLDGVNVAALALMALVSAELARSAVVDALTAAVAVLSAILLIAFRINSTWLIAAGALVGSFAR